MKNSLFLVGALVVGAVSAHFSMAAPSPGPKRPGPSAVQAARLKKYPPGGYLSHYLPDDRYKIAGGVWKYVSTDLDTYYHIPSSPNMMRQPANRVIGFANARDAEEAGYVPDPTDGTARQVAPPKPSTPKRTDGFTETENRYLREMLSSMGRYGAAISAIDNKILQMERQNQGQPNSREAIFASLRPLTAQYVTLYRGALSRLNRLKPPPRLRRYHSLWRSALVVGLQGAREMDRGVTTGNVSDIVSASGTMTTKELFIRSASRELDSLRR